MSAARQAEFRQTDFPTLNGRVTCGARLVLGSTAHLGYVQYSARRLRLQHSDSCVVSRAELGAFGFALCSNKISAPSKSLISWTQLEVSTLLSSQHFSTLNTLNVHSSLECEMGHVSSAMRALGGRWASQIVLRTNVGKSYPEQVWYLQYQRWYC